MIKIKVFTQEQCPKCPPAKRLGEKLAEKGKPVEFIDVKKVEGLTEAILHNILSTPSIVVVDHNGKELAGWRAQTPSMEEIEQHI